FEIGHRIDRARALAHFEMKLRPVRVARHARKRDLLTAPDGIAALHLHLGSVPVDRHEAVLMPNEYRVAETFQPAPRIGDDAVFGRVHGGTLRHRDVYAVIGPAIGTTAETGNHTAAHRPAQAVNTGCLRRQGSHLLFGGFFLSGRFRLGLDRRRG